jgi:NADH-quinone oxidoreductase subunit J
MSIIFYIAAIIALAATILTVTRRNAIHALLYLIVSFFAIAVIFYMLGAPFIAALEVIIYAGAIMVLFIFVMMMLNLGKRAEIQEKQLAKPSMFIGPVILSLLLTACFIYLLSLGNPNATGHQPVGPQEVGTSMFTTYLLGAELAGMLILAGLVGAYHLARRHEGAETDMKGS